MPDKRMVVGGEFVFAPDIFFKPHLGQFSKYGSSLSGYKRYYTFGAYYSLKALITELKFQDREYVLLPSYLCPTILYPFREAGIRYEFYKMTEGLRPDIGDIDRKTKPGLKTVLFIDYFGFPQKEYLSELVSRLQAKGVKIIQDTVQAWLDFEGNIYGDFCFNSVRKYTPFEASVIMSKSPMSFKTVSGNTARYLKHKRYAQFLRYCHIKYGLFHPSSFLNQFKLANQYYHGNGIVKMPKLNKWLLDKLDFECMGQNRKYVYKELLKQLRPSLLIRDIKQDAVPLGMAIYLEDRDKKKSLLHGKGIHCPVHWLLPEEIDKHEHEYCWELQSHALTLPVNFDKYLLKEYIGNLQEVMQ